MINSTATVGMRFLGPNPTLRGIELNHDNSGATGIFAFSGRFQNLVVTSNGDTPCQIGGARLTDSICHATATNGRALRVSLAGGNVSPIIRNATLIASGSNGPGIYASVSGGATVSMDVRSSIIQGSPADVEADLTGVGSALTVTLADSNFDSSNGEPGTSVTAPGGSGNQIAPPIFTGPSFEQAAGSPTIDAGGVDAETGTTDVYGDARPQGAANDIGADESPVPVVLPLPPADTTAPDTTITKKPNKKTKSRNAKFAFSASEPGSTFECKVDKDDFKACSSPLKLKRLKRRSHSLSVRATDAAGNVDATPTSYKWKVKKKTRR